MSSSSRLVVLPPSKDCHVLHILQEIDVAAAVVVGGGYEVLGSNCAGGELWIISPAVEEIGTVPEIARFFGIIIRMYVEAGGPHHRPHFHAYYQQEVAIYGLDSIDLIAGSLPQRQRRFVEAWAELHEEELRANWERLQEGRAPRKIEPLS